MAYGDHANGAGGLLFPFTPFVEVVVACWDGQIPRKASWYGHVRGFVGMLKLLRGLRNQVQAVDPNRLGRAPVGKFKHLNST